MSNELQEVDQTDELLKALVEVLKKFGAEESVESMAAAILLVKIAMGATQGRKWAARMIVASSIEAAFFETKGV